MSLPVIAVVGRPNVGKSRLINRIASTREAIVHEQAGVTRDRNYVTSDWSGKEFTLIDTGGIQTETGQIEESIKAQAEIAINEADVILFLVDRKTGLVSDDIEVAKLLRPIDKPMILAVNKVDDPSHEADVFEFYKLGFGDPIGISAEHGLGIDTLLDKIVEVLPEQEEYEEKDESEEIALAIIGKPNAGKSSLFNKILGIERTIVSDIAGTTRDAIDSIVNIDGQRYRFIDTAGVRKKSKITENLEYYSYVRALKAVDRAEIAIMVVDGAEGFTEGDQKIVRMAIERGVAVLLAVNKMDIVAKDVLVREQLELSFDWRTRYLPWVPRIDLVAKSGKNVPKLIKSIKVISDEYKKRINTAEVNSFLENLRATGRLENISGKRLKIYYGSQVKASPPVFRFSVNNSKNVTPNFKIYLEKEIRKAFGFSGVPIILSFKGKQQ